MGTNEESELPEETSIPADEWGGLEPTEKKMGMVSLVLDKGVKTTVVGTIYGMDFEIEGDNYQIARIKGESVAAASAEISVKNSNAEMTDCATIASAQGRGIMQHLLMELEKDLKKKGIMTAYTLARAPSFGMNCAFFRLGYEFSGRLINNCDIFGHYEDMNIWVKRLDT